MILAKKEKTLPDTKSGPLFPLDAFRESQRKRRDGKVAMKMLYTLRNYILYCGIEKDAYNAVKKDAYVSNFMVWRILHGLMTFVFALLFVGSLSVDIMAKNKLFYSLAPRTPYILESALQWIPPAGCPMNSAHRSLLS